jgi:glutathione-regulated potassium-efflux system ancillary protein KefC
MNSSLLFDTFIFLAAACVIVPIAGRFKLGSVLGYLLAGVLIGPFGLAFIDNPEKVMHFAEFGIVMMLFLIGLELEPPTLWKLRKAILGLGGLQVITTTAAFTAIGISIGYDWKMSVAASVALSLSSTALVLQMLEEKDLLKTSAGESSFAVLLFQDIAVIPILIIMPLLASGKAVKVQHNMLSNLPGWLHTIIVALVIVIIIVGGRYLSRYLFRYIAKSNLREVFTATSLALVVGITLLMNAVGVSPALGAFIAGMMLANSEYRHTLDSDLQPFKGLLLGLFFISIGMGINFALISSHPFGFIGSVTALILVKMLLLYILGQFFGLRDGQGTFFSFALAQGGEFAFVLFQYADGLNILSDGQAEFLTLTVAISMVITPFLMMINDRFVIPRFMSQLPEHTYDKFTENNSIILAGYGRFGQIIGRFLNAQNIKITVLEKDPEQIELLRKFGHRGYFGDASRLDLLQSAGAAKAKLLVVAVDDADKCIEIVKLARQYFPNLKIYARARNRRHAYELHKAGADYFRRETFDSSLVMAQEVMKLLGSNPIDVARKAMKFMNHDEKTLLKSFEFFESEPQMISFSRQAAGELESIFQDDINTN